MNDQFVHLHSHTIFSVLDGVAKPEEYFDAAKERGWPAVAITEHGVFSSIPDAYWASKETGIKQIIGCEVYFNDYDPEWRKRKEAGQKIKDIKLENPELAERIRRNRHLTVLAKNKTGFDNLLKLNRTAWETGYYYKPRVWFDELAKHKEGLIVLSGCLNGPVANEFYRGNKEGGNFTGALDYFKKFNDVFGDDYYIEIQMPCIVDGDFDDRRIFEDLVNLAQDNKKKLVVTNDSHYMTREDFDIQKTMMAIDQGLNVNSPDLFHVNSSEQFYKTRDQLRETFKAHGYNKFLSDEEFEKACDNTLEVADKVEVIEFDTEPKLPHIENANEQLIRLSYDGLKEKGLQKIKKKFMADGIEVTYIDQLKIELQRIIEKGFSSYFLITKELVDEAKGKFGPDSVGPARGSAGGSLVCFVLGITTIDPLKWKLSFSRMLSTSRGGQMLKVTMD
jgi:DNA polymerase-3 subunit alpha